MHYRNGASTTQRQMVLAKPMSEEDMSKIISYLPPEWDWGGNLIRTPGEGCATGAVNMAQYMEWLQANGYKLGNLKVQ